MRLIDADALLEDFKSRAIKARHWKEKAILDDDQERIIRADATLTFLTEVKLTIEDAPTVEPTFGVFKSICCEDCDKNARPQGKWRVYEGVITCEKCGEETEEKTPFCAWCGADMRGEEE